MRPTIRKNAWVLATSLCVLSCLGCGGPSGPEYVAVSGTVSIDGKPVEKGVISFVSEDGKRTAAGQIVDGAYEIPQQDGPSPGQQKVSINAFRKTGERKQSGKMGMFEDKATYIKPTGASTTLESMVEIREQFLPAKFNSMTTLTAKLKVGRNGNVNFELSVK